MTDDPSSNLPAKGEVLPVPRARQNPPENKSQSISFSGPIPPPGILAGYEDACVGAADRIIRMSEQEAEHRRTLESAMVQAGVDEGLRESDEAKRGQFFALTIVVISIGAAITVALYGHDAVACTLGVGGLGSIVATFILGRSKSKVEERPSAEELPKPQGKKRNSRR